MAARKRHIERTLVRNETYHIVQALQTIFASIFLNLILRKILYIFYIFMKYCHIDNYLASKLHTTDHMILFA